MYAILYDNGLITKFVIDADGSSLAKRPVNSMFPFTHCDQCPDVLVFEDKSYAFAFISFLCDIGYESTLFEAYFLEL